MRANISSDLASQVDVAEDSKLLDVVVELDGEVASASDITQAKAAFSRVAGPVTDLISSLGGEVVEGAWINHTLLARLPAARIPELARLDHVTVVDVPHALRPD